MTFARRLPRWAAHFSLVQVDGKLTLGEAIAVGPDRHLGRKHPLFLGKGAPRGPPAVGTIAHRFYDLGFHHPLALVDQLQRFFLIAGVARPHFHPLIN